MRFSQFAFSLFFVGLSVTAYSQFGPDQSRIIELESKWSGMFGKRDLDGIMALMAKDSVLIMPGAEPMIGR